MLHENVPVYTCVLITENNEIGTYMKSQAFIESRTWNLVNIFEELAEK